MKLYSASYAPNPRRVTMFLAEKGVADLETIMIALPDGEQATPAFREKSPLGQVPVLALDDGRYLTESRAICAYLETLYPAPNLLGDAPLERAEIEMWDRRVELGLMLPLMHWVRHTHPALAKVEKNQTPSVGAFYQAAAMRFAGFLDQELSRRPWIAGDRFTIADITAACGVDFAKLMKWRPGAQLPNLQRWRDAFGERPAGKVPV